MQQTLSEAYKFRMGEDYTITSYVTVRNVMLLLRDGICPDWQIFSNPIHNPRNEQEIRYKVLQEAVRKDVERCFGILQSRFYINRRENSIWDKEEMD